MGIGTPSSQRIIQPILPRRCQICDGLLMFLSLCDKLRTDMRTDNCRPSGPWSPAMDLISFFCSQTSPRGSYDVYLSGRGLSSPARQNRASGDFDGIQPVSMIHRKPLDARFVFALPVCVSREDPRDSGGQI